MVHAVLVQTPTDFARTIEADDFVHSVLGNPEVEIEPDLRGALAEVFRDLPCIDGGDPDLLHSYLSGIEEPLRILSDLGFALFAINMQGARQFAEGKTVPNWRRVYYLVVPTNGLFRVGADPDGTVHRFAPDCGGAVSSLCRAIREQAPVRVWKSSADVRKSLEGAVSWRMDCCLTEIGGT
jgi:hypothetical protein